MIKSNSYLNFDSIFGEFSKNLKGNPKLVKILKKITKKSKENKKESKEDFFKVLPSLSDIKYKEINLEYLNNHELDELIAIQSLLRVPSIKKLIKNVEMEIIPDIEIEISRLLEHTFNNNTFDNFESSIDIENIIEYAKENYSINKKGFFFNNFTTEEDKIYEYYANQLAIRYNHYYLMTKFYEEELEWRNFIIQGLKDYDIHFLDLIAYIYKTSDYEISSLTKKRSYYQNTHLLNHKNNTFDSYFNGDYDEIEKDTDEILK